MLLYGITHRTATNDNFVQRLLRTSKNNWRALRKALGERTGTVDSFQTRKKKKFIMIATEEIFGKRTGTQDSFE